MILQFFSHPTFPFHFFKTPEERYARFKNLRIITVKKVSGYFHSLPRFFVLLFSGQLMMTRCLFFALDYF